MSIDEAIAKYKEITNTDAVCPAHCNIPCEKCVQESEQLVEWLEELKELRNITAGHLYAVAFNRGYLKAKKEVRDKAIDDFVENISLKISESIIWGMLVNSHKDNSFNDTSDKIVDYVINTANEIAEQLKAGGKE